MRIQHVGQDCYLYVDTPVPTTHSKIMWCVCCGGLHILRAVALPFCSNPTTSTLPVRGLLFASAERRISSEPFDREQVHP